VPLLINHRVTNYTHTDGGGAVRDQHGDAQRLRAGQRPSAPLSSPLQARAEAGTYSRASARLTQQEDKDVSEPSQVLDKIARGRVNP
jgi:hypothetical protein